MLKKYLKQSKCTKELYNVHSDINAAIPVVVVVVRC